MLLHPQVISLNSWQTEFDKNPVADKGALFWRGPVCQYDDTFKWGILERVRPYLIGQMELLFRFKKSLFPADWPIAYR